MKCKLYFATIASLLMLCLTACNKREIKEKEIIGTYFVSEVEENEGTMKDPKMIITLQYDATFNNNHTFTHAGVMKVSLYIQSTDYTSLLNFDYGFTTAGRWKLQKNTLLQIVNPDEITIRLIAASASTNDEMSLEAMEILQESIEEYFPKMIAKLNQQSKILTANSSKLVVSLPNKREIHYLRIE